MIKLSDEQLETYLQSIEWAKHYRMLAKRKQTQADDYLNKQIALYRVEEMNEK
jgi:hypothetical protein